MAKQKKLISLTEGPIFFKILSFAFPIMVTGLLQVLYNMADNIVVGQFSGDPTALGSVGSTSAVNSLILNIIVGISGGAGVVVSHHFGAKENHRVSRAVHTAIAFSVFLGLAICAIGFFLAPPVLTLMETKSEYLDGAVLYLQIICLGIPASAISNFSASILRSVGDSRSPMIILSSSGIINVILNLFFVIVCGMTVAGVALATIISQYASAALMLNKLTKNKEECYSFSFSKLCIDKEALKKIIKLGVPAGIQGSLFSFSNIVLTNGVNTLAPTAITAYTIANNIDALTFIIINSFQHATTTFVGQNFGAKKFQRIKKTIFFALIQVTLFGILVGQLELLFGEQISAFYVEANDPNREAILATALSMMTIFLNTYFLCGIMEVLTGTLRGLGYSVAPMIMTLTGACGFRVFWRFFVFPMEKFNNEIGLLVSFPISWVLTIAMLAITLAIVWHILKKKKLFLPNEEKDN